MYEKFKKPVVDHFDSFIVQLQADLKSHEAVLEKIQQEEKKIEVARSKISSEEYNVLISQIPGGQCFAMALTAFSALDFMAYIFSGGELNRGDTSKNLNNLLQSNLMKEVLRFNVDPGTFTKLLRHGMVHQLFPRNISLRGLINANQLLIRNKPTDDCILETYYLLSRTIKGMQKFRAHISEILDEQILIYYCRLQALISNDMSQFLSVIENKIFPELP